MHCFRQEGMLQQCLKSRPRKIQGREFQTSIEPTSTSFVSLGEDFPRMGFREDEHNSRYTGNSTVHLYADQMTIMSTSVTFNTI